MQRHYPRRFDGKVALVMGVGRGSTKEAAVRMAAEGADMVLTDIVKEYGDKAADECRGYGRKVLAFGSDAADGKMTREIVDQANKDLGKIDILVYAAIPIAIGEKRGALRPFHESTDEEWDREYAVTLKGFTYALKAVLPGMMERNYGKIVFIATDAARQGSTGQTVDGAMKAAGIGLVKTLAREYARYKINVNVVSPGPHATPLVKEQLEAAGDFSSKIIQGMVGWVPFKRLGEPDEIGAVTCFMASDDASYMTGQTISVSGGLSMF
jgi:2-hydroxycyclohexanecarboxyl-CoA dehydrogenase